MITKAVIPAAGLGTRFLPFTKGTPKELLPVIDVPVIDFVVREAVNSGITDILIILSEEKSSVEKYFRRDLSLEKFIQSKGNNLLLKDLPVFPENIRLNFLYLNKVLGLGHTILQAKDFCGSDPFAVLLGDTFHKASVPVTRQLLTIYEAFHNSVVAVEAVPSEKVHRYGIIDGEQMDEYVWKLMRIVEKPTLTEAPSHLAVAGRYVFTPSIFVALEITPPGKGNEIQISDAMQILLEKESLFALQFTGKRYDIGNKLDYLKTMVELAIERDDIKEDFLTYLSSLNNPFAK